MIDLLVLPILATGCAHSHGRCPLSKTSIPTDDHKLVYASSTDSLQRSRLTVEIPGVRFRFVPPNAIPPDPSKFTDVFSLPIPVTSKVHRLKYVWAVSQSAGLIHPRNRRQLSPVRLEHPSLLSYHPKLKDKFELYFRLHATNFSNCTIQRCPC
jgi:hypothetical protein